MNQYYSEEWELIKEGVMCEWGYDEDDMDEDDIEDAVNRETDQRFTDKFGSLELIFE